MMSWYRLLNKNAYKILKLRLVISFERDRAHFSWKTFTKIVEHSDSAFSIQMGHLIIQLVHTACNPKQIYLKYFPWLEYLHLNGYQGLDQANGLEELFEIIHKFITFSLIKTIGVKVIVIGISKLGNSSVHDCMQDVTNMKCYNTEYHSWIGTTLKSAAQNDGYDQDIVE